jgi:protein-tyrosine phosphatase
VWLTESGRLAAIDHGVGTIIDLRKPEEVSEGPYEIRDAPGMRYLNISLVDPAVPRASFTTLAGDYQETLDLFAPTIGRIIGEVGHAAPGAVLIHCVAGKDRSGIIAALLLRLAGVPAPVVAEDYALSDGLLQPRHQEYLEHGPGDRSERRAQLSRTRATREVMLEVLTNVEGAHGSVRGYLLQAGLTDGDVDRVQTRLRE